jgi:hypothetical protein
MGLRSLVNLMACIAWLLTGTMAGAAVSDIGAVQEVFARVFGDAVTLDPAMHAQVLQGKPGERHYVDRDQDGKPEEVWFIDTDRRHPESMRPVLVRVIDEDGDLERGFEPDLDSDLYVADWKADGMVDVVCDYTDRDGDQDVDEMAFYFPGPQSEAGEPEVRVWWGDDIGDDNLLWYDIAYTYSQPLCQYRTHFGGDELFCAFSLNMNDPEWVPLFENPFAFYDHDHDGVTEEVIRIEGRSELVAKLRYSFDADHDATPDSPRDFDVSVSAHAREGQTFDPRYSDRRVLRGIPTGPFLDYHVVPKYARETAWGSYLLTWVENDLNIDGDNLVDGRFDDLQPRWEGVIAKGNDFFKQLGGPSGGLFNKRVEGDTDPTGPIRVYFAPTDQRIHLYGAERMWLLVDLDYDQKPDMRYEYRDANGDGYIDTWQFDADNDGTFEDTWTAGGTPVTEIGYSWAEVSALVKPVVASAPEQLFALDRRLREALATLGVIEPDVVWRTLESGFELPLLTEELRVRLLTSNAAWRYYLEIWKDRMIVALKARYAQPEFWQSFDALRAAGDYAGLRGLVETAFKLTTPLPEFAGARAAILAKYDKPRVAWGQDWVPPNIGWESDLAGYRAYWGQFDFFGKSRAGLVISTFGNGASYHEEQDWGMDALHVGQTAGIGGVTLYVNGQPYPVYSPNGEGAIRWSKRLVSEDKTEVCVELLAENVGPEEAPYTVRFVCRALAGRKDSPVEVRADGGQPEDRLEIGVGLTRLPQESYALDTQAGVMASWGVQEPAIGTIGMGVVFAPGRFLRAADSDTEHQVVLKATRGEAMTYHIQGDWLRGRRFNRCPELSNWMNDLRETAQTANLR